MRVNTETSVIIQRLMNTGTAGLCFRSVPTALTMIRHLTRFSAALPRCAWVLARLTWVPIEQAVLPATELSRSLTRPTLASRVSDFVASIRSTALSDAMPTL